MECKTKVPSLDTSKLCPFETGCVALQSHFESITKGVIVSVTVLAAHPVSIGDN